MMDDFLCFVPDAVRVTVVERLSQDACPVVRDDLVVNKLFRSLFTCCKFFATRRCISDALPRRLSAALQLFVCRTSPDVVRLVEKQACSSSRIILPRIAADGGLLNVRQLTVDQLSPDDRPFFDLLGISFVRYIMSSGNAQRALESDDLCVTFKLFLGLQLFAL